MATSIIKPRALNIGDTIGIVSPSSWAETEHIATACNVLEKAGYHIALGTSNQDRLYQFAGTPEARARDIEDMFLNTDVKAIFCSRGGFSAIRVRELIDLDIVRDNPKIFMGFSDITYYLLHFAQNTGLITFHGPMLYNFKHGIDELSLNNMVAVLSGTQTTLCLSDLDGVKPLRLGVGSGELWGGNLYILTAQMGTPWELDTADKILFIEDVDEPLHKIESMLRQLRSGGKFAKLQGLIVGEFNGVREEVIPFGSIVEELVMDSCRDYDFPIIFNVPCGHGRSTLTMPISVPVKLTVDSSTQLEFLESPVNA